MKRKIQFFALMLMGIMLSSNLLADSKTITPTAVSGDVVSGVISFTTAKNGGTSAPAFSSNAIRLYQNTSANVSNGTRGGSITFTAASGYVINQVSITNQNSNDCNGGTVAYQKNGTGSWLGSSTVAKGASYSTGSNLGASTVEIACFGTTNKLRLYITSITVEYASTSSGSTYTLVYAANGGSGTMTDSNSPYAAGAEVMLMANTFTAPTGKRWDSWKVTDASSNNVTVTDGKITMPASNVTVTAQWVDACSRSITISKGSESNGTFTLGTTGSVCIDGGNASTTVTCSPNAHYHVREVTSTGGGSVTGSGNSWTVSDISANTTINVTFEEDTKYTVIFKNAGTQVSSKQVYANEAIGTLPEKGTMESCDNSSTTFMGWTSATISEKTSTEPTYVTAETVVDHDNFVVNAVWAREK